MPSIFQINMTQVNPNQPCVPSATGKQRCLHIDSFHKAELLSDLSPHVVASATWPL